MQNIISTEEMATTELKGNHCFSQKVCYIKKCNMNSHLSKVEMYIFTITFSNSKLLSNSTVHPPVLEIGVVITAGMDRWTYEISSINVVDLTKISVRLPFCFSKYYMSFFSQKH